MARAVFPSGRKSLLLLALAAAIIGGAWWWQRPPPEPVHNGQRLSDLLAEEAISDPNQFTPDALHAFEPGVILWLTYTAEYGRHPFQRHGPLPFDHAPGWLRKWLPERWDGPRKSSSSDERTSALRILGRYGPEAVPAIMTVTKVLEHQSEGGDVYVAHYAAMALNRMGPASWPVVEETLRNGSPHARQILLATINFRLGSVEKPADQSEVAKVITTLVKACHDQDASVRRCAATGIRNSHNMRSDLIALDPLMNELIYLLHDSDMDVRLEAIVTLGYWNAKETPAIPRLIELLDDRDGRVRGDAAQALGNIDRREKRSAARLRKMFRDDPDAGCRYSARAALKAFGLSPDDKSAAPEALP